MLCLGPGVILFLRTENRGQRSNHPRTGLSLLPHTGCPALLSQPGWAAPESQTGCSKLHRFLTLLLGHWQRNTCPRPVPARSGQEVGPGPSGWSPLGALLAIRKKY